MAALIDTRRRVLLTAFPVATAALAVPTAAGAIKADDPLLPLYREWPTARAEWLRQLPMLGNDDGD